MSRILRAFQPVSKTDFTITNQGTTTITDGGGGFTFSMPGRSSTNSAVLLTKAIPTAPYTIEANVQILSWVGGWEFLGLVWKKGDLLQSCCWGAVSGGVTNVNNRGLAIDVWNKYDNYAGSNQATAPPAIYDGRWLRIRDNGTNRYCDISRDGQNWTNIYSVARGYWFTDAPTDVGFIISNYSNGASAFIGQVHHFKTITAG